MRKDKPTFITLLVLFVVFLGMSIYGGVVKYNNREISTGENVNKEFYYSGSLYFYDEVGELLGTYKCVTDTCGYAISADETYLDYYYSSGETYEIGTVNSDYVFLQDGENVILYNFSLGFDILTFEEIKFYNTTNTENFVLVKLNGLWGAITLSDLSRNIEIMYEELSIGDITSGDYLSGNYLLAKFNNMYYIIDNKNITLSEKFSSEIVDYTEKYIITYDDFYHVYDYEGNEVINFDLSYYTKSDNYYAFVYNNFLIIYSDLSSGYIEAINIDDYTDIAIEEDENGYKIYVDDVELVH